MRPVHTFDEVLRLVMRSLRGRALPPDIGPEMLATVSEAKAAFVLGGMERLKSEHVSGCWLQVNVALVDDSARRRVIGDGVRRVVARLQEARAVSEWHFVFKSPGIRLRLRATDRLRPVVEVVERTCASWQSRQWITAWSFGAYDGEQHLFGGATGFDLFHQFSTVDSRMALQCGAAAGRGATLMTLLASAIWLQMLVRAVTADAREEWDTWRNCEYAGRLFASTDDAGWAAATDLVQQNRSVFDRVIAEPLGAADALPARVRGAIQEGASAIGTVGRLLQEADERGLMLWQSRRVVPFFAIFHWNRLRMPIGYQRLLASAMTIVLNPYREKA